MIVTLKDRESSVKFEKVEEVALDAATERENAVFPGRWNANSIPMQVEEVA